MLGALLLPLSAAAEPTPRSFTVANDEFVKDGAPVQLRSGSLHYFRVPQPYWEDSSMPCAARTFD